LLALDARIVLHDPQMRKEARPHPAIRPYPEKYVAPWTLSEGVEVCIRPIRPEDEPLMVAFNNTLSPESIYLRYFHPVSAAQLVTHEQLARMCFIDYNREMTLVAERKDGETPAMLLALGQLTKLHGSNDAEFAVLVGDQYQRIGLGTELLRRLLQFGRDEGLDHVVAEILPENEGMKRICARLGFTMKHDRDTGVVHAELAL
jgi:acetyltransferase